MPETASKGIAEVKQMVQRLWLEVKTADLGLGKILLVDLKQLRKIGLELLSEDPEVLLCDSNECHFCSKHRKK